MHFRVLVKNHPHPTKSLTLRVVDLLATDADEARLMATARYSRGHRSIKVLPVRGQALSEQGAAILAERRTRWLKNL